MQVGDNVFLRGALLRVRILLGDRAPRVAGRTRGTRGTEGVVGARDPEVGGAGVDEHGNGLWRGADLQLHGVEALLVGQLELLVVVCAALETRGVVGGGVAECVAAALVELQLHVLVLGDGVGWQQRGAGGGRASGQRRSQQCWH